MSGRRSVSRAANALKKAQKRDPRALDEFAAELISAGLTWHGAPGTLESLAAAGRLRMTARQDGLAVDTLFSSARQRSALERVHAMQSLANLSVGDAAMLRTGTPGGRAGAGRCECSGSSKSTSVENGYLGAC